MLTTTQRRIGLACALLLAVAMTVGADKSPQDSAAPVVVAPRDSPLGETTANTMQLNMAKLARTTPTANAVDLFAAKSWASVKQHTPVPDNIAAPTRPLAPPMPFRYVGQMKGRQGLTIVLSRGSESISLRQGEQIGDEYRLESVAPEAVTLLYLPLNERQTLMVKSK